jgi:hypothetical protein
MSTKDSFETKWQMVKLNGGQLFPYKIGGSSAWLALIVMLSAGLAHYNKRDLP